MSSIGQYLNELLEEYAIYRGLEHTTVSGYRPFWDAVVITTSDENQQTAFQQQLDDKRNRKELPTGLDVHVVPDPPGVRIGNGGSTLTVLEFLESKYGSDLNKMKVFLIHAGGWSQRMPSAAVMGKIFSVLPYGNPPFQMLDLKLAFYWPFVGKLQPGIFVVCADDFSIHNLGKDFSSWSIPSQGFTALAHPSPISLGRAHGVYVLENPQDVDFTRHVVGRPCIEVLQKPNDERMRSRGAVLSGDAHTFADGIRLLGETVFTDSCFYFGTDVVQKLLRMKKSIGKLTCEIDAYGDILQSLGENATVDYIYNTANISQLTESLLDTRKIVFDTLRGSDIHLLLLNASAYIHIGTTKELLYYMCRNEEFQKRLNFKKDVFNSWINPEKSKTPENGSTEKTDYSSQNSDEKDDEIDKNSNVSEYSCIIHSSLHCDSEIGPDSYIEFCDFQIPVKILGNSIVSNCQICMSDYIPVTIPENTFLHTIPIIGISNNNNNNNNNDNETTLTTDSTTTTTTTTTTNTTKDDSNENNCNNNSRSENLQVAGYVTVVFNIDDNLKKKVPTADVNSLPFNGSDLKDYLCQRSITENIILPYGNKTENTNSKSAVPVVTEDRQSMEPEVFEAKNNGYEPISKKVKTNEEVSLWDLKLYPSFKSMTSSVLDAIAIKQGHLVEDGGNGETPVYYSLSDLLGVKDVNGMLGFRRQLYDRITLVLSNATLKDK